MATLISTPQQLDDIRNNLSGTFELSNDINMSSWGNWIPIDNFSGSLDGKGFVISNLSVDKSGEHAGLFGSVSPTFIKNLGMENCTIISQSDYAGAIAGYINVSGMEYSNLYVKDSYIEGDLRTGGLFGQLNKTSLRDSFSLDNEIISRGYVGGMVGRFFWGTQTLTNCYSASKVTDTQYGVVGGLIGGNDTTDTSLYEGVYFDVNVSTQSTDPVATGKTTAEMQTQSTYTSYDFTNVWGISGDYPYLQMFGTPVVPSKQESRSATTFVNDIHSHLDVKLPPKIQSISVNSYVNPIQGYSYTHKATLRNVGTFTLPISSNVTTDILSVNVGTRNVFSFVNPINSSVTTDVFKANIESINVFSFVNPIYSSVTTEIVRAPIQKEINVMAYMRPLQANTDVSIYIPYVPVMGYISVIENRSRTSMINNPSSVEVKE